MAQPPAAEPARPRAGRLKIAIAAVVFLFLIAWYAVPPAVPQAPMKLVRGEGGEFAATPDGQALGANFQAQFGTIAASNSMFTGSGESNSDHARLACRRILVRNKSDHLLAKRVAGDFLEALKKLRFVDEIDYLPAGQNPRPGGLSPDVFITLSLDDLSESGLVNQVVDAQVAVTISTASGSDTHDRAVPPTFEFQWTSNLLHHSTTYEVASSAAKYKLVADDIAKQIGPAVVKQLGDWRDKYGLLPPLPAEFYPEYQAPPELPLEGWEPQNRLHRPWAAHAQRDAVAVPDRQAASRSADDVARPVGSRRLEGRQQRR